MAASCATRTIGTMHITTTSQLPTLRRVAGATLLAAVAGGAALVPGAGAHAAANTNSVAYWCGAESAGVKYEPVADPFLVPVPPDGQQWTIAVVKAGSGADENFVVQSPVSGDSLSFPGDAPANSHVILCWAPVVDEQPPPPPAEETPPPPPADEPPVDQPPADEAPPAEEVPVVDQWTPPPPPVEVEVASASQPLVDVPADAPAASPTTQLPATGAGTGVMAAIAIVLVGLGAGMRRLVRAA
jgi:hypothetical protein